MSSKHSKQVKYAHVLVALVWTPCTLGLDIAFIPDLISQFQSLSFLEADGKVLGYKEVQWQAGGDTHYKVAVSYAFEVAGQRFTAERVGFGVKWNYKTARAIVAAHPVDSALTVYYEPADPNTAVLFQGFEGESVLWVLFLIPFNVAMLWMLLSIFYLLLTKLLRRASLITSFIRVIDRENEVRVRLPRFSPLVAACLAGIFAPIPAALDYRNFRPWRRVASSSRRRGLRWGSRLGKHYWRLCLGGRIRRFGTSRPCFRQVANDNHSAADLRAPRTNHIPFGRPGRLSVCRRCDKKLRRNYLPVCRSGPVAQPNRRTDGGEIGCIGIRIRCGCACESNPAKGASKAKFYQRQHWLTEQLQRAFLKSSRRGTATWRSAMTTDGNLGPL